MQILDATRQTAKRNRQIGTALALVLTVSVNAHAQDNKSKCTQPARVATALPVTIPFELSGNHVVLSVCRGDKPLRFTLDTGSGNSVLDMNTARSMGIVLRDEFRVGGAGAGTIAAAGIARDSVYFPGLPLVAPIGVAMDFSGLNTVTADELQGIIGADFLSRYIVSLDYRNHEMHVYDRDAFTYSGNGTVVPIRIMNSFIRVNAAITLADGARIPGDFVVDVGSALSLALAKPFVQDNHLITRVSPTVKRRSGHGVGGSTDANVGRLAELNIGGVVIPRPTTYMNGDSAGVFSNRALGDGNIGGDILRRFVVYLDYRGRRMIFEKHDGTDEPFEIDMSGLRLVPNKTGAGLMVEDVMPISPAGDAGLVAGDIISSIDGQVYTGRMLDQARKKFMVDGATVSVTVRRNGADTVVRIKNKRMV